MTVGAATLALLFQWSLYGIVEFGDIGFDHPGRYGLDFGHFLLIVAIWALLSVGGIVIGIATRRFAFAGVVLLNGLLQAAIFWRLI